MKVGVIDPVGGHGGMNYYDSGLIDGISIKNTEVFFFSSSTEKMYINYPVKMFDTFSGMYGKRNKIARVSRFFFGVLKTLALLLKNNVDVIHLHFFHVSVFEIFSIIVYKLGKFPIVITIHDVESFGSSHTNKNIYKYVYNSADALIIHNEVSKAELKDRLKIDDAKIWVVPHGAYSKYIINELDGSSCRKILGLREKDDVVLFFGQIKQVKGLDVLIKAIGLCYKGNKDIRLVIAGKMWKEKFEKYASLVEASGIASICIPHIEYIPDDKVHLYYRSASITVLPYRKIYQSGVLLMAMSYHSAVVVSDIPGMTEIIKNKKNGLVFSVDDEYDLARNIEHLLKNEKERNRYIRENDNLISEKYNWDNIGGKVIEVYASAIKKGS